MQPLNRSIPVGNSFHSANPSIFIQKVLWHPLSDNHLAILTSDNTLRQEKAFISASLYYAVSKKSLILNYSLGFMIYL